VIKNFFLFLKSLLGKQYSRNEVFGLSRTLSLNYVERAYVDDEFRRELSKDSHIVIFGGSKQGKTSLRKKCLLDSQYILLQCSNKMKLGDLFTGILKQAGFNIQTNSIDPEDPNDVVTALGSINFDKLIVLEDFHYLPVDTQKDFSIALKTIHETSKYKFILTAVWLEDNRLIIFNSDLTGRVISINADKWSEDDLMRVIDKGGELLNIDFDKDFKIELVKNCFDSVYIIQEACNSLCEHCAIDGWQPKRIQVGAKTDVAALIKKAINKQSARYESFLTKVADGHGATEFAMYKWILYAVVKSKISRLERGLPFEDIRDIIKNEHPKKDMLNIGNITQSLNSLASLQIKKGVMPIIIDYDKTNNKLNVVEKSFLIWLNSNDSSTLAIKIISSEEA